MNYYIVPGETQPKYYESRLEAEKVAVENAIEYLKGSLVDNEDEFQDYPWETFQTILITAKGIATNIVELRESETC